METEKQILSYKKKNKNKKRLKNDVPQKKLKSENLATENGFLKLNFFFKVKNNF